MSSVTKPLMLDDTAKQIVEALTQREMTQTRIREINEAADAVGGAIEAKAEEQLARIPEVTKLQEDVEQNRSDIAVLQALGLQIVNGQICQVYKEA